jgi:adenine-specific DNA-methyltransferase
VCHALAHCASIRHISCPNDKRSQLDPVAQGLARSLAESVAGWPLIDALNAITCVYPVLLEPQQRSELGAFHTPPSLTRRLFDMAEEAGLDWRVARVLDPASGGGAFLLEAAVRLRRYLQPCEPAFALAQIEARLRGMEIDPHAAALSQVALEILLSDLIGAAGRQLRPLVKVCDALEEPPMACFDLVIGNPPYGRVALSPQQRQRFARSLYGHANLYGIFTDLALRWAQPAGIIAFLTPTSVLGGQYYAALRRLLVTEAPPSAINFVDARRGVFEDVLQETMLAIYHRRTVPQTILTESDTGPVQVHYLSLDADGETTLTKNGTIMLPTDPTAPWIAPREPADASLVAKLATMPTRLADWGYKVSTGPLVWNRFKTQMREHAGADTRPIIWAEAVTADGRFVLRADKRNHTPHLAITKADEWLIVTVPCVLIQRTTAKEQARRLIAAELPADVVEKNRGVVVENHLNMVVANSKPPRVSAAAVAAVLNSMAADRAFRSISGSVAVSAFELEALPLPSVEAIQEIEELLRLGADRCAVDAAVCQLYGLAG